jgi:hypothetical protein
VQQLTPRRALGRYLWADRRARRVDANRRVEDHARALVERAAALFDLTDATADGPFEAGQWLVRHGWDGEARVTRYRRDPAHTAKGPR